MNCGRMSGPLPEPDANGHPTGDPDSGSPGMDPGVTNITLIGDGLNDVPFTTVSSVTCKPGINVSFGFPRTNRFAGLEVFLVAPYGGFEGRAAVEAAGGVLYWAVDTPQLLPQHGTFALQTLKLISLNTFAPGTITISGSYSCP